MTKICSKKLKNICAQKTWPSLTSTFPETRAPSHVRTQPCGCFSCEIEVFFLFDDLFFEKVGEVHQVSNVEIVSFTNLPAEFLDFIFQFTSKKIIT